VFEPMVAVRAKIIRFGNVHTDSTFNERAIRSAIAWNLDGFENGQPRVHLLRVDCCFGSHCRSEASAREATTEARMGDIEQEMDVLGE
jgi:hypothetical protein